jgi:putative ABC transport system permease protein
MLSLIWTNFTRKKGRLVLTLLSVLIAFLLFGVLMAVRQGFSAPPARSAVAARRLVTINKVAPNAPMPVAYARRIAHVPGVQAVAYAAVMLGSYQKRSNFVPMVAVPAQTFLQVFPDMSVSSKQYKAWVADRTGVLVTPSLAKRYGWKVGEQVPLKSTVKQKNGDSTWDVTIDGVVSQPKSEGGGTRQNLFMHYKYLDEARAAGQGTAAEFAELIADPDQASAVSQRIDNLFANAAPQTRTASENDLAKSIFASFGNIGAILVDVTAAIFFSMLLIIGAIMVHSARERLSEFAVLRALGFRKRTVTGMVLGESILTCLVGGGLGLILAHFLVAALQGSLSSQLPGIALTSTAILIAIGLMVLLGLLAGALPAVQTWRLSIRDALGRI